MWNGSPLTFRRHNDNTDVFTREGEATDKYYKNLPIWLSSKFPMLGTNSFGDSDKNCLYLPERTQVYLIRRLTWTSESKRVDLTGWVDTNERGVFWPPSGEDDKVIYSKLLEPGHHIIDNNRALYLFTHPS